MNKLHKEIEKETKGSLLKKKIIYYSIQNGNFTISEVAKEIDVSIPTATKLINEMCLLGYIEEYGKLETNEGRHPLLYSLNPNAAYFVGVDISHQGVSVGLINFKGEMIDRVMEVPYKLENSPEALDKLVQVVKSFIERQKIDRSYSYNR